MDNSELKRSAITGAVWKFLERIGAQAVSLVVSIVLARMLTPDDYSVVGIVSIFFVFCNVFISGGFNLALIRKKDADMLDYSSVLYVSLAVALVLYGILAFAAPAIAQIYEKPILTPVFRVMGLALIINSIKSVVCAHISNNLQFRKFFFATLSGTVTSAVVGISLAYYGFGPWALVAQNMTNSLIDTIILFATTKFRPLLAISWKKVKDLFSYGWKLFVASIITVAYDEACPLIIGLRFSGADLAFYTKGRSYPAMLNSSINGTLSAVLFPVMSKVQEDTAAVCSYTRRFIRVASFVIFPMMVGFLAVSDTFISLLLTDKWLPAAQYIKIFCISYMFGIIQDGNLQAIRAIGRSDIILKLEVIKKTMYAIILVAAVLLFDRPEILAATVLANTAIATVVNTAPNRKLIGYRLDQQLQDIIPNLSISAVMGAIVYGMNYLPIPPIWLLLLQISTGALIYVGINLLIKNPDLKYVWQMLLQLIRKKK